MHIEVGLIAYSGLVVGLFFAVAMIVGAYGLNKVLTEDMRDHRGGTPQDSASSTFRSGSNFGHKSENWRDAA